MKKRFSDEQIISILREAEAGVEETAARRLLDVCYARSDAWEKENGGTIYVR
ncbi:hypothetical protein LWD75_004887 [Escherichia coli]|uniref:hypothetical protein n=1 Tax=Escherichia coli TaxID=562 RepID=UPI000AA6DB44|nr:hypothetical protein [Escherichia coli]EHN6955859.1 hypothetical protein [Escherichia coli]EHN7314261.1 hypothetical protein [Escherichia coli]EIQ9638848.1 hypothetical protein [Escherichia coli]EIT7498366.1 hypothetical protein [Escherichia coli]EJY7028849.1 hypothetical protein [Escherichia coli]